MLSLYKNVRYLCVNQERGDGVDGRCFDFVPLFEFARTVGRIIGGNGGLIFYLRKGILKKRLTMDLISVE